MRIVFFGTPEIAVPFLRFLCNNEKIVAVVTQPDVPVGRGKKISFSPVKIFALEKNLPLFQPSKVSELIPDSRSQIPDYDLGIVVAYGKILPLSLIKTAKLGYLNVHFSLLPRYRGAAPVQWAVINGEKESGVSIFWLDEGLDTGKIIIQKKTMIENEDTAVTLQKKLVTLGIKALEESFKLIEANPLVGEPQKGEPSYAPVLKKEDGRINWNKDAEEIHNLIRGTQPWPGAYTTVKSVKCKVKSLKIIEAEPIAYQLINLSTYQPGTIVGLEKGRGFVIKCKNNFLLVKKVQEEGKKVLFSWDWWQGARLKVGDQLG